MEEIDINMSEENKERPKEYQKNYKKQNKKQHKFFYLFFFTQYKMEQKALIFGEDCINKNAFHKNKRPINIEY